MAGGKVALKIKTEVFVIYYTGKFRNGQGICFLSAHYVIINSNLVSSG
jgi:hypothetical protein